MKARHFLLAIGCTLSISGSPLLTHITTAQPTVVALSQTEAEARADVLYQQINELLPQGQFEEINRLAQEILEITEAAFGANHPRMAVVLHLLGSLSREQGNYAAAVSFYERSIAVMEPFINDGLPDELNTITALAHLHRSQGNNTLALPLYEQALAIRESTLAPDHPQIAEGLTNLAQSYYELGDYNAAVPLFERALAISERAFGNESAEVAEMLNGLAVLYQKQGEYTLALPLFERSLAINKATFGEAHPAVGISLGNIALIYREQGDLAAAISLFEQALAIVEASSEVDPINVASVLTGLGLSYKDNRNYTTALPLLERALSIFQSSLNDNHPSVATALNNLGGLYQESGDLEAALPLYQQALTITESTLGPDHPDVANRLSNLALLYAEQKDYTTALPLFERALAIRQTTLSENHPYLANSLLNLAGLQALNGNLDRFIELYKSASEIEERNLNMMTLQSSETRRLEYVHSLSGGTNLVISTNVLDAPNNDAVTKLAFTTVLRRKGRSLDVASNVSKQLRSRLSPENKALLDELNSINGELASQYLGTQAEGSPTTASRLEQLASRAAQIENTLARNSSEFATATEPATIEAVQAQLPENAALIEFVQYAANSTEGPREDRYAAYVLNKNGKPQSVDLGKVEEINPLIVQFRNALSNPSSNVQSVARQLDEKLMSQIRPLISDTEHLIISPDSQLMLLPFESLVGADNRYLIEQYQTSYLNAGRELLSLNSSLSAGATSQQAPVIFANPNYDSADIASAAQTSRRSVDLSGISFAPLPGTEKEANEIAPLLSNATLYTQSQATEATLKQINAPSILHIATHGFFLPDVAYVPPSGSQSGRGASLDIISTEPPTTGMPSSQENGLLRSGLALAGANQFNQTGSQAEDGLLTALEASGLDLYGTQLVVLSACETGLGVTNVGQGMYGLRQALVAAGSQSQIVSLWLVDDIGTSELMKIYYQNLIEKEQGRSEALRQAQIEMLSTGTYAHPYYWSSFVFSGDWRPLSK